ncbi:MAG: hypothetical protein IT158_10610 [Bryobacterales bacterium]|nr:hypothetical protein [Bryobacterales bacterium]
MSAQNGLPKTWLHACRILLLTGVGAFIVALAAGQAQRAWQAYLLNFLFWTGIAQCGVIFSAAYVIVKGQWSDALRRMAESLAFFLPVSLVLFLVMMLFGAHSIFPWTHHPFEGRESWLTVPAVTLRDTFVFLVVFGLSAAYIYYSQRTALRSALQHGLVARSRWLDRWIAGAGNPGDIARSTERARTLAPILVIAFALGFSLIGFDLIMTLEHGYANTLLGWYFYVGAFYAMLAVLAIGAAAFREPWGLEAHLKPEQSHDLGRLLFGFCLLTGGLFWAQWLVFWYGNLPEEIAWVIPRFYRMPYAPLAWIMTYGAFIVPLVVLLSKQLKRRPKALMAVAVWILAMLWLERYVWIVPTISRNGDAPLLIEVLITLGFAGGFAWGWLSHNRRFPLAAISALPGARRH